MSSPRIDAHHHLWRYTAEDYGWMSDEMSIIRRDFLPGDLAAEIDGAGVDGVVTVQARQSPVETEWLLELARRNDFMRGVVGWVPLVDPGVGALIERYAADPKLKAVRHVLHDEPDDDYMLREDFNRGIGALASAGLAYDILIFERHLEQIIEFVDRRPNQVFVLDHAAKPRIADGVISPWRERMRELARRENVYCKISGMVTEANWKQWSQAQLSPYMEVVLEAFGPERLMFGSDWPVCLVACEYGRWFRIVSDFVSRLTPAEQDRILGGTAIEAYKL